MTAVTLWICANKPECKVHLLSRRILRLLTTMTAPILTQHLGFKKKVKLSHSLPHVSKESYDYYDNFQQQTLPSLLPMWKI